MKREDLRAIEGMTEDMINQVLAIHGRDAQASKALTDNLQQQLTTAQQGLAKLGNMSPEAAVEQIATLTEQLRTQKEGFEFDAVLRKAAREAKALDEDDVIALLPGKDNLVKSQDRTTDVAAAFAKLKAGKPYLFGKDAELPIEPEPPRKPGIVTPKPNPPKPGAVTVEDFIGMSGQQRMALRDKDPGLFAQLANQLRGRK